MIRRYAVTLVVVVTLLLSAAFGWLIVKGTEGQPVLPAYIGPIEIHVNTGHDYVFVRWNIKEQR